MALSKKLVKAVKQAQKQAEATVVEVREALDSRLSDVNVDPTPFYAVIGAANRAVDTIKHAGEQLEVAAKQASTADLRKGAKKEAAELQKELQKRIADLQTRTTEMQKLASQLAEKVLARAQDLPAQVMNQGLVLASNAKDQYDAAAGRGERVVSDMRTDVEQAADEATSRAQAAGTRTRKVAGTVVEEGEELSQTVAEAVQDDAEEIKDQLAGAAKALDEAAAPEETVSTASTAKRTPAKKPTPRTVKAAATKKTATKKAATKKATAKKAE